MYKIVWTFYQVLRVLYKSISHKSIYPKPLDNWKALYLVRHCRAACLLRKWITWVTGKMVQISSAGLLWCQVTTDMQQDLQSQWKFWQDLKALAACIKYEWGVLFVWSRRHQGWCNRSRHGLDLSKQARSVDPSSAHGGSDLSCSPSLRAGEPARAELLPWAAFPWLGSGCLVLCGRTGLASIPESSVSPAVPPPRAERPWRGSWPQPAPALPIPQPAPALPVPQPAPALPVPQPAPPAALSASSSGRGWYRLVWPACHGRWKAATAPFLPPSPLPSRLEQACAGLCLMPRELCCSFLKAAQAPAELASLSHIDCDGKAV